MPLNKKMNIKIRKTNGEFNKEVFIETITKRPAPKKSDLPELEIGNSTLERKIKKIFQ